MKTKITIKEQNYLPIFLDMVSKNDMLFAHLEDEDEESIMVDNIINNLSDNLNYLIHFKDAHTGLYATDKHIDDIFADIPEEKDCKTVVEAYLVQQIKLLKSLMWRIS